MDSKDRQSPSEKLSSAEYRARLLTKLNCLVAVLEVAIDKISRSMDVPGANHDRLTRIRANLQNTLSICTRAKQTLESAAGRAIAERNAPQPSDAMTYRDYVELRSIDEYRKFKDLPPITGEELENVDVDDLISRLLD